MNTRTVSPFRNLLNTVRQVLSQGSEGGIPLPIRRPRLATVPVRTGGKNLGEVAPRYSGRVNIGKPLIR